jgi:hypothetical protein
VFASKARKKKVEKQRPSETNKQLKVDGTRLSAGWEVGGRWRKVRGRMRWKRERGGRIHCQAFAGSRGSEPVLDCARVCLLRKDALASRLALVGKFRGERESSCAGPEAEME